MKHGEFEAMERRGKGDLKIKNSSGMGKKRNDSVAGEIWKGRLRYRCSGCVYNNEVI